MAYSQLPTRTTSDANASSDVNQLQTNIEALKGGTGSAAPSVTLEDFKNAKPDFITKTNTDYAILDNDGYSTIAFSTGNTNRTCTLPTAADNAGRYLIIMKTDSGTGKVTIDGEGAETINGVASVDMELQYTALHLKCTGSGWIIVGHEGCDGVQVIGNALEIIYSKYLSGNTPASSTGTVAHGVTSGKTKIITITFNFGRSDISTQMVIRTDWSQSSTREGDVEYDDDNIKYEYIGGLRQSQPYSCYLKYYI